MAQQVDHHLKGVNWILDQTLLDQILSIMNEPFDKFNFSFAGTHTHLFLNLRYSLVYSLYHMLSMQNNE